VGVAPAKLGGASARLNPRVKNVVVKNVVVKAIVVKAIVVKKVVLKAIIAAAKVEPARGANLERIGSRGDMGWPFQRGERQAGVGFIMHFCVEDPKKYRLRRFPTGRFGTKAAVDYARAL